MLALQSATHGVEGFAGSACILDLLRTGAARELPPDTALLLVHAINPWGFAWIRRTTAEGVDLNRNFVDFSGPLREDHWLHAHGGLDWNAPETRRIKTGLLRHFYPDADDWREMVLFRSRQFVRRALVAMAG